MIIKRTAIPTIAGVINIVIGSINLLVAIGIIIEITVDFSQVQLDSLTSIVAWFIVGALLIFGLPSLIGGIYAIQRKSWAMALIGSITSLLIWNFIGLIPLILVILSKGEFGTGDNKLKQQIPMVVAKERYTKGEITKEQFEQIKDDLA
ncbi:SHOCT domain-containing protein [Chloroflexota bacterium]